MASTAYATVKTDAPSAANVPAIAAFRLIPNIEKAGAQRILKFFVWVCLPFFATHLLFRELLELSLENYVIAQLPVLIILLNLHYFLTRRAKAGQGLQLCIEMDELCLKSGGQILHRQKLHALSVQQLGWGAETENRLPAIRIQGPDFPTLLIGTTSAPSRWTNIRQSVEFTDYWLGPGDSWEQLKALLLE